MKQFLYFFLVFVSFSLPVVADSFSDVEGNHPNYPAIEFLSERGVIDGYDDGTFKPEQSVNRAEAVKMIVNAFDVAQDGDYIQEFPDVFEDDWFFPYVMSAYEASVLNGYDDGLFRPENTVNLAETLRVLVLATNPDLNEVLEYDVFVDVARDQWFAPYALYAREKNVLIADTFGRIYPGQEMTRGAFAEAVYRMMLVVENSEKPYELNTNWIYYDGKTIPFRMKYDDDSWDIIERNDEVIFYQKDDINYQFSPTRTYPNSGKVVVTFDKNEAGLNKSNYFANLKTVFPNAGYTEFLINGLSALEILYAEDRIVDWYIYLDDGSVLVAYTEYGDGLLSYQTPKFIGSMLGSFEYKELSASTQNEDIISLIYANVLVAGKGMDMIAALPDRLIIETDVIGVGTGAVDYYYSETLDFTLKYERDSNVILDTREGKTSAF